MRTDDRVDLALPTDECPTPDSKILVRNSMGIQRCSNGVNTPFMTKKFPFPNVVVIFFGCRGAPTLRNDPNALC